MQNNSITSQTDIANVTVVTEENQIIVPQPITNVVEVNNPGPQGPVGPQGATGPSGSTQPFSNMSGDIWVTTSSLQVSGSFLVSGSSTFTNIGPAIFSGSANIVGATTMSSALVSGNVTVLGTASIGTLVINQTVLSTGSNQLGDSANDTQTLYGSVIVPTGSLTVTGSINATSIVKAASLQASGISTLATTFYYGYLTEDNNSNRIYLNANELDFWTNSSSTMRLTKATKSVGIGTTTPSASLHVSGSGSTPVFRLDTPSTPYAFLVTSNGSVGIGESSPSYALQVRGGIYQANSSFTSFYDGTVRFGAGNSYSTAINSSGLVGIGTITPASKLHISGSTSDILLIASSSAGTALYVSGSGNVGIGTTTPTSKLELNQSASGVTTIAKFGSSFQGNYVTVTVGDSYAGSIAGYQNAGTKRWELTNGGDLILNHPSSTPSVSGNGRLTLSGPTTITMVGNVGIGTTTPQQSLEISGSGIRISGAGSKVFEFSDTSFAAVRAIFGSMSVRTSTGVYIGNNEQAPLARLHVSGSSSEALLRVDSPTSSSILYVSGSGFVGVGTNNPVFKLDVSNPSGYSAIGIQTAASTNAEINFKNAAYSLPRWTIRATSAADGSSGNLTFQRLANTFPMTITSGDNVLIGTSTDSARLMVKGSGTTSATTTFRVENNNASASLVIKDDGTIGVNTTSPSALVSITGDATWPNVYAIQPFNVNDISQRLSRALFLGTVTQNNTGIYISGTPEGSAHIQTFNTSTAAYDRDLALNYYGGSVGIGRIGFPRAKLHITGSTSDVLLIASSSAGPALYVSGSGNVGIGTNAPTEALDVRGNILIDGSTDYRLKLGAAIGQQYSLGTAFNGSYDTMFIAYDALGSPKIITLQGNGNVGIGTNTPAYKLDVSGSSQFYKTTSDYIQLLQDANSITFSPNAASYLKYGSNIILSMKSGGSNSTIMHGAGTAILAATSTGVSIRSNVDGTAATSMLQVRGSGATSATTTFLLQNSTPTNLLSVLDNGQVAFTTPTMSLAASQSAFSISPIISASNIVGGQYYGVSITPTFFQTTGSQTETAFRVAATFTSSNATATSGSNIIADFGSTSAGSQLTVTDVTSGSIYMVNDVSGIPIIEATSNWDVNMYDFPNKVFEKTGSQVNIYGTMRVSGSFILPLSQSVAPQTGSAYWSGSFLFIYDGTRYMSASFA